MSRGEGDTRPISSREPFDLFTRTESCRNVPQYIRKGFGYVATVACLGGAWGWAVWSLEMGVAVASGRDPMLGLNETIHQACDAFDQHVAAASARAMPAVAPAAPASAAAPAPTPPAAPPAAETSPPAQSPDELTRALAGYLGRGRKRS